MRSKFTQTILLLFCLFASQVMKAQSGNEDSFIPGQYIVVYKNDALANTRNQMEGKTFVIRQQIMHEEASSTLRKNGLQNKEVLQVYETALKGFAVRGLTEADLSSLLQDEKIAYIEPDQMVYLFTENKSNLEIHDVFNSESNASKPLPKDVNILNGSSSECFSLEINGTPVEFGSSSFGPFMFNVTGQLILADDGASPSEDGCEPIINDLSGKIALIKRGTCNFSLKVYHAQQAGAIAVIIYNNVSGFPPSMGAGVNADLVTIPAMSISDVEGQAVIDALALGTVTATMIQFEDIENTQCTPWGITRVSGGLSGAGKKAWIIDTGIDMDHPDLNVNDVLSYSVIDGEPSTDDLNGHGTHVAGTVAAIDNGFGVIGVAAGAEVVAVKVFPGGAGGTATSNVIAGLNYVAANAAAGDVVNYSIGGGINQATDDAALAVAAVCPIVISAGNNSGDANDRSPQRIQGPNVYVISAMDPYDNYASFSNYGNPPINYCAPGVKVVSTYKNGTYGVLDGTSMAAPHVAGLLLLGDICATSTVNLDPDGNPDPIAEHSTNMSPYDGGSIADNQIICYGDTPAAFSSIAPPSGAVGPLEYQWQLTTVSPTANFDDWLNVGSNNDTYTHMGTITQTTWFRRLARVCLTLTWETEASSNVVQVDVNPFTISTISGIIDDFEDNDLPYDVDAFGNGIGFVIFGDFGTGTTVDISTTQVADTDPLALPGQSGDNHLLQLDANVNNFGGLTHAFENEDLDTWVTQDWSSYEGIAFWLYGQNTGNDLYFEVQDNRNPGSTTFDVELWTHFFVDDFSGWQLFVLNFDDDFIRKEIGNGAPNDGFGRDEVHGWAFGTLNTGGATVTYYLDNVKVYGNTTCPNPIVATTTEGDCSKLVTWDRPVATSECGPLTYTLTTDAAQPIEVLTSTNPDPPYQVQQTAQFPVGITQITHWVEDAYGNTASCTFTVTIHSFDPPEAAAKDITIQLDAAGQASISPSDVDNGSFVACIGQSPIAPYLALSKTSFDCSDIGANVVTLTVADKSGRTATATATVTVQDVTPPEWEISCATIGNQVVDVDEPESCFHTPVSTDWDATATDACSAVTPVYTLSGATEGSGTSLDGQAFNIGVTTVTWTATDASGNSISCSFTVTVLPIQLSGVVSYYKYNAANLPLEGLTVSLINNTGGVIISTTTAADGSYLLEFQNQNQVLDAVELEVSTTIPHGGLSIIDATAVQRRSLDPPLPVSFWEPESFLNHVGNVYVNANDPFGPPLNFQDALLIQIRLAIPSTTFDAGEWAFYSPADQVLFANNTPMSARRPYQADFCELDIEARTYGDVMGNYNPTMAKATAQSIQTDDVTYVQMGEVFELPLFLQHDLEFNAMMLDIIYNTDKVEVLEIQTDIPQAVANLEYGNIRLAWADLQAQMAYKGDGLITLVMRTIAPVYGHDVIFMQGSQTEFGNQLAEPITDFQLGISSIANTLVDLAEQKENTIELRAYPNPFRDRIEISYQTRGISQVRLILLNAMGVEVATLVNGTHAEGTHSHVYHPKASNLSQGLYFLRMESKQGEHYHSKVIRLIHQE